LAFRVPLAASANLNPQLVLLNKPEKDLQECRDDLGIPFSASVNPQLGAAQQT
jgi:hypothetical protein